MGFIASESDDAATANQKNVTPPFKGFTRLFPLIKLIACKLVVRALVGSFLNAAQEMRKSSRSILNWSSWVMNALRFYNNRILEERRSCSCSLKFPNLEFSSKSADMKGRADEWVVGHERRRGISNFNSSLDRKLLETFLVISSISTSVMHIKNKRSKDSPSLNSIMHHLIPLAMQRPHQTTKIHHFIITAPPNSKNGDDDGIGFGSNRMESSISRIGWKPQNVSFQMKWTPAAGSKEARSLYFFDFLKPK